MKLHLEQINDAIQFRGRNESGDEVTIASADDRDGVSPMEMVAMSVGGCSSVDILRILDKQRQTVDRFEVDVDGTRATDETPAVFTDLHVHYTVEGDVDPDKVQRAIDLSLGTYCSVSHMLEATVDLSYAFTVNGTEYDGHTRQPE